MWGCYCRWGCGIWQYTGAADVVKRKRKSGGNSPRGGIVRARADSKEELRRQRRAAKFAADAAKAPPPIPKRTFAHPGGKITSNKEEATQKFLRRQKKQ